MQQISVSGGITDPGLFEFRTNPEEQILRLQLLVCSLLEKNEKLRQNTQRRPAVLYEESLNSLFSRFIAAIGETDLTTLRSLAAPDVQIDIPGATFVDITRHGSGVEALCEWARKVRAECGRTTFAIHRYFENGCEAVASGRMQIERFPQEFTSPCACHILVEQGKIAQFQLLFDTYALQKFRGQMD